jgi:anti-sigma regulatory factor (Ser/Thr protein kinase)
MPSPPGRSEPRPMPAAVDVRLIPEPQAPARARGALQAIEPIVGAEVLGSLRLLVSELVANGVRHGTSRRTARIRVLVRASQDAVRVEVSDPGPGFQAGPPRPRPRLEGGWGLFLVDRIADRWGVRQDGRTVVWVELDRR